MESMAISQSYLRNFRAESARIVMEGYLLTADIPTTFRTVSVRILSVHATLVSYLLVLRPIIELESILFPLTLVAPIPPLHSPVDNYYCMESYRTSTADSGIVTQRKIIYLTRKCNGIT